MKNEYILYDSKPCIECNCNYQEGGVNFKCPYDKMAEDFICAEELEYIQLNQHNENL
jgi:hypothetical protein